MTPKSLLRHPAAVSPFEALAHGTFQRVIADDVIPNGAKRRRRADVLGQDVLRAWKKSGTDLGRQDVAIIRMEQFYPFPYTN